MRKYVAAGYDLRIGPVWQDVTMYEDEEDGLDGHPHDVRLDQIVADEEEAIAAVRRYFAALRTGATK